MTSTLALRRQDVRDFRFGDERVLLHIPSTSLFAGDGIVSDLLDLFHEHGEVTQDQLRTCFDGRYPAAQVVETLHELIGLRIVGDGAAPSPAKPVEVGDLPVNTVILNVNTGCNLACSYCYKEDLSTPVHGNRMDFATAARAVDLTFEAAAQRPSVNVVFFGGEPLTNVALIRQVVDHAEARARETGKRIDFSLTTNATLLNDELVDYFQAHRFGLTISMDGPRDIHDRHRRTIGGHGTYDV
ncbi:MAG TPA: radical SAM protein, partial [Magnetospirillum sp.]|nr:radical SAM protein [Magnetospirillum sp.]